MCPGGGSDAAALPQPPEPDAAVRDASGVVTGDVVELHGLTSEAGKRMNDHQVVVVKAGAERHASSSCANGSGKQARLKLCNLRRIIEPHPSDMRCSKRADNSHGVGLLKVILRKKKVLIVELGSGDNHWRKLLLT